MRQSAVYWQVHVRLFFYLIFPFHGALVARYVEVSFYNSESIEVYMLHQSLVYYTSIIVYGFLYCATVLAESGNRYFHSSFFGYGTIPILTVRNRGFVVELK